MNYGHLISKKDVDINQLRKNYNIVDNYVEVTLPRRGYWRFFVTDIPVEDKLKMVKMYQEGYDTYTIGKAFDMSYKQITKVLDEYDIKRVYSGAKRKYTLNEHYFDEIDTSNKAYILGFLYADGHSDTKKNIITLTLQEGDVDILNNISNEIESNKPLAYVRYDHYTNHNLNSYNQYRLRVHSYIMSQALDKLGCTNKKSLTLTFPKLKDDLYSHFLRGYFDGDGCICRYLRNDRNDQYNYSISMVSTKWFLEDAQKCIIEHTGVSGGGIHNMSYDNGVTKNLDFCGRVQVKTIADWLYKDAELYLKRKYERYISYFYENNS